MPTCALLDFNMCTIGCEHVNRKEALPTWGMAHEKQLKAMMYACNANNWDSWENLEDKCHSEPAMVDARYIVTLDKVLSKGKLCFMVLVNVFVKVHTKVIIDALTTILNKVY